MPGADGPWVQALGWALLHSLWQGAVLAGVYALARRILGERGAQARYLCGCVCLLLLLVLPLWTATVALRGGAPTVAAATGPGAGPLPAQWLASAQTSAGFDAVSGWLAALWVVGALAIGTRQAGGWALAGRLTRHGVQPAPEGIVDAASRLARRLRLGRQVRMLRSPHLETPAVVGWLRPAVLLPSDALAAMRPREIDAILAHELAHVRRHDYPVNLLQAFLEALLFFHPAVWWISSCVRQDRELCCDDLAAAACGDRLLCARALMRLEELRGAPTPIAIAAHSGRLFPRIHRLLAAAPRPGRRGVRTVTAAFSAVLLTGFALSSLATMVVPAAVPVVLNGLDPVHLVSGDSVAGSARYALVHGGFKYRFADTASRDAFQRAPERFAVRNARACPISGRRVRSDVFRVIDGRTYLFCCPNVPAGLSAHRLEPETESRS